MTKFIAANIRKFQVLLDALLIAAAWFVSYGIRFHVMRDAQVGLEATFVAWFVPLLLITLYFLLKNEQYDRRRLLSVTDEFMRLFRANALSVISFIIILYFISEIRISRLTIVLYAIASTIFLIAGRLIVRSSIRKLRRRGYLLKKVFVAGDEANILRYLQTVSYTPGTGLNVSGVFLNQLETKSLPIKKLQFPLSLLDEQIKIQKPDLVVLGFNDETSPFVSAFIREHYDDLVRIQVMTAENQSLLGLTAEMVDGLHLMTLNEPRLSAPELFAKRALDLFGSGVGLLFLSPFFAIMSLSVKFSSSGPIFFGQERVGIDGRTFKMWKFRTMRVTTLEESKGWTIENDPRRTGVGTFLRKTSLDELPQLWNVFVGEMSLVGPRPEQTHFVEKFRREIPAYMLRHKMKAGITGWAQVSGWRGDTSLHKRIECDLYYIRHWNIWFDIKILALTFIKGFINKNAY